MTGAGSRAAFLRNSALLGSLCWLLTSNIAQAQGQTYVFDIPAEPLGAALRDFARTSGQQIIFSDEMVSGKNAPGLHGSLTSEEALGRLLSDSGLSTHRSATGGIIVQSKNVRAAANDAAAAPSSIPESVTVTGTLIPGIAPVGGDVQTYTRLDIQSSGSATLDQFARQIPQNFSGADTVAFANNNPAKGILQQGAGNNIFGGSNFNLNGLGPSATLTLLNGHRLAPGSYDGASPDISQIPVSAIDRIEILDDGASALYGSDAVAGVINIITRKDFDGAETSLRYGGATDGGAGEFTGSQAFGHSWNSGNVFVNYEYDDQQGLDAAQRSYIGSQGGPYSLLPKSTRNSIFASGSQDIWGGTTLSGDVLFTNRDYKFRNTLNIPIETINTFANGRARQTAASLAADRDLFGDWHGTLTGSYSFAQQILNQNQAYFIPSSNLNASAIAALQSKSRMETLDGLAHGSLFDLPGGAVRAAVGGSYRSDRFDSSYVVNGANSSLLSSLHRSVQSLYAEVFVPVVGDANAMTGIKRLELSVAFRYDNYSDFGQATNPKVGLRWEPVSGVTLNGSYGTSYQAPLLSQLGSPTTYAAQYIPDATVPAGRSDVIWITGGNTGLKPEKSVNTAFGIDIKPALIPGLTANFSYYATSFKGEIQVPSTTSSALFTQPLLAPFLTYNPSPALVQSLFAMPGFNDSTKLGAAAVVAVYDGRIANIASVRQQGLNFSAHYDLPTDFGQFSPFLAGTHILKEDLQNIGGAPVFSVIDTYDEPASWKLRGGIGWTLGQWSSRVTVNYVNSYQNNLFSPSQSIAAWTTADLNVSYRFAAGSDGWGLLNDLQLSLSVQNITDENPPYVQYPASLLHSGTQNAIPYDSTNASPLGRVMSLQLTKSW